MTSITKDAIGFFQLRRNPYFPYITFNLIRRYCEIGDNAYKYQSHGGWFMAVFGLLPVIWTTCPFTWQVGLFNGTVLALVFNIITYILFSNKIERIEAAVATQDINTQIPEQNLSLQIMEERNKTHNYRLYSKLFVIVLGILPGIWRSCPFTWQAGLIIGIAIAIVFNIITYILFYNKIKRIAVSANIQDVIQDAITQRSPLNMQQEKAEEIDFITKDENSQIAATKNTTDAQKQTNHCMHIDPECSYFVSLDDTNLFMMSENGKHYILITDNEECMQRTLLKFKDTANDKPVQEHISAIINWIETSDDIDGLYFAGDNDYQLFSKEELASMTFRDFLDIKIEEKCHDKQAFFAIMRQDDDESWYYVTSGGHLAVFLTDLDANLCASKNGFERFKVKEIHPKDILHVVQECDGLKIMGCDGLVLYENNVKRVTKILQKYIN